MWNNKWPQIHWLWGEIYGQSIKHPLIDWFSFLDLPKCFCPKSGIPIISYIFTGHFKPFLLNPSLHCNNRMLRSELYAPFVNGSVKCVSFGHIKVLAEELLSFLLLAITESYSSDIHISFVHKWLWLANFPDHWLIQMEVWEYLLENYTKLHNDRNYTKEIKRKVWGVCINRNKPRSKVKAYTSNKWNSLEYPTQHSCIHEASVMLLSLHDCMASLRTIFILWETVNRKLR